jgi:hypothetical protein
MPRQPNQIIGAFTFRNEGDGCLTSKYHNGSLSCPFIEACKLINPTTLNPNDIFIGEYQTIWLENNNHVAATLIISRRRNNPRLFDLNWRHPTTNAFMFDGTAMIYENILVGTYWD